MLIDKRFAVIKWYIYKTTRNKIQLDLLQMQMILLKIWCDFTSNLGDVIYF